MEANRVYDRHSPKREGTSSDYDPANHTVEVKWDDGAEGRVDVDQLGAVPVNEGFAGLWMTNDGDVFLTRSKAVDHLTMISEPDGQGRVRQLPDGPWEKVQLCAVSTTKENWRDKLAEFLIMVAVNWIATPDYRDWYEKGKEHDR